MSRLMAYLQLCRFAALFTALADILAGYTLTRGGLTLNAELGWLLGSSTGLYLAGMVFNDVFDRKVDAVERPKRPIPSGRVSVMAAIVFGTLLLALGVGAAAMAGKGSLLIAALLVASIFAYDGWMKKTPAGPVGMGLCRLLNLLLGASTAANALPWPDFARQLFQPPQICVAACMGTYIAGVTWFAREEAGVSRRTQLYGAIAVLDLGLLALAVFFMQWRNPLDTGLRAAVIVGFIAFNLNRRLLSVTSQKAPGPAVVQAAVRTLLLSLITLDAAVVFFATGDIFQTAATLLLLVPALLLGKALAIT